MREVHELTEVEFSEMLRRRARGGAVRILGVGAFLAAVTGAIILYFQSNQWVLTETSDVVGDTNIIILWQMPRPVKWAILAFFGIGAALVIAGVAKLLSAPRRSP